MASAGSKSIRFAQVVERSGTPHVHTLWVKPENDPELQRAQKSGRVMTIEPGLGGSKADVGIVGFETSKPGSQFLIFPKSLKRFSGRRVVGVKFDLVEQPKLATADVVKSASFRSGTRRKNKKAQHAKQPTDFTTTAADDDAPDTTPAPASAATVAREEEKNVRDQASADATPADDVISFPAVSRRRAAASRARPPAKTTRPTAKAQSSDDVRSLKREVKLAIKELERGKSVAAYQRLQRAITDQ